VLTGLVYPLVVTGIGKGSVPEQVSGSLVMRDGKAVGSSLIGSHSRSRSIFGGGSPPHRDAEQRRGLGRVELRTDESRTDDAVKGRVERSRQPILKMPRPIPVILATASGSGLDPHISPAAALYQAGRVARERHMMCSRFASWCWLTSKRRNGGFSARRGSMFLLLNLALDRAQ